MQLPDEPAVGEHPLDVPLDARLRQRSGSPPQEVPVAGAACIALGYVGFSRPAGTAAGQRPREWSGA
jgi:hypothetical protein